MLDFETLYSESRPNAFTGAKNRFYDNRISGLKTEKDNGKTTITGTVSGHRDYTAGIIFDEQGGLYDYFCDCDAFCQEDGPCKHILAVALSFEDKNPSSAPQRKSIRLSDAGVKTLIGAYSGFRRRRAMLDAVSVRLEPVLDIGDSIKLRFSIGGRRMYKLKDVEDFARCYDGGLVKKYGIELFFAHIAANFDDQSAKLASFLSRCVKEKSVIFGTSAAYSGAKDEVKLFPSDIDEFFTLMNGRALEIEESRVGEGSCLVEDKPLKETLKVASVEGGYEISLSVRGIKTIEGKNYGYIVTPGKINRMDKDVFAIAMPLLHLFNIREKLFVSQSDMSAFYNNVIEEAAAFADIEADTDLTVFESPPFFAKLFLDYGVAGTVEGKVVCGYGEQETDLFSENSDHPDYETERAFARCLKEYFPYYPSLVIEGEDALYRLISEGVRDIYRFADVFLSERLRRIKIKRTPKIRVGVKMSGDLLDLDFSGEDYTPEELNLILKAGAAGEKYVRIGESFVDLGDPSIEAIGNVLKLTGGTEFPAYYAPHLARELGGSFLFERDERFKRITSALINFSDSDDEPPEQFKDILRSYQVAGFKWLMTLYRLNYGGILADDMGLGKSLQIIALLKKTGGRSIIVCPTSLILNWEKEFKKFAPEIRTLCVIGSQSERLKMIGDASDFDVVITSYELIRRDIKLYETEFDVAVVDEAQFIKNPGTKNARAVKTLKAKHRFALTGTPIENNLAELWSIFDFVMPGYLFEYPRFRDEYEVKVVNGDKKAIEELKKLALPFVLRRLKSEVLKELPPKIETEILIPLSEKQEDLYRAHVEATRRSLLSQPDAGKIAVLSMLTKLRLICCDPSLVDPRYDGNSEKLEMCLQILETAAKSGHKALVFSQFTSMLDILRRRLLEKGITNYVLKGDTPKSERMKFVNRFNKDETEVFLISLRAGGTGLNLTGADVVVHYDPWWNDSVMKQATDRAYRIGQDKSVQVYSLIMDNTVEKKITELQRRKAALGGLLMRDEINAQSVLSMLEEEK